MKKERKTEANSAIDNVCDEFTKQWRSGKLPRVADFVATLAPAIRSLAIKKIVAIDLEYRQKHGLPISESIYQDLPSDLVEPIKRVFDSLRPTVRGENDELDLTADQFSQNDTKTRPPKGSVDNGNNDGPSRYRIRRMHAQGGLGEVYVATDEELGRRVALKQIQDELADNPLARERFELEAHVTGSLEHPGIVPVYGFGKYPNGRPYYAMRFIRGQTMKEAIKKLHSESAYGSGKSFRKFEFRELLNRYVDACQAIAFAHSRGVLHRDIKPSNIMLGKYGETLVVDWGLAKTVDRRDDLMSMDTSLTPMISGSQGSATVQGSTIGTPAYMSPEQALGLLDQMTAQSDVYSLGATLYMLLTGKPAFDGKNAFEILEKVKIADFKQPIELNPPTPKALNAICLKAMSLRPEDRYDNTLALAKEIDCYMADQPVKACRDSLLSKMGRWVRNYRVAALSIALCLVGISIASIIAAVMLNAEKSRTEYALAAETEARIQTQNLINGMYQFLVDKSAPGPEERLLLETLLGEYEKFAAAPSHSPADKGNGYVRIANCQRRLGLTPEAVNSVDQAIEILSSAVDNESNSPKEKDKLNHALASGLEVRAWLFEDSQQLENALTAYEEAELIWADLVRNNPENVEYQIERASLIVNKGNNLQKQDNVRESDSEYSRAYILFDLISSKDIRNDLLLKKIQSKSNLAAAMSKRSESLAQAVLIFEACEKDYAEVLAKNSSPKLINAANTNLNHLAGCYSSLKRYQDSARVFQKAIDAQQPLVTSGQSSPAFAKVLAEAFLGLGKAQAEIGYEYAGTNLQEAKQIFENLFRQSDLYATHYSNVLEALGTFFRNTNPDLSSSYSSQARVVQANIVPKNVGKLCDLFEKELKIGETLYRGGKYELALPIFQLLVERTGDLDHLYRQQLLRIPKMKGIQRVSMYRLGSCLSRTNSWAKALPVWERLCEDPDDPKWNTFELQRAICLTRTGRVAEGANTADTLLSDPNVEPINYYDVACVFAVAAEILESDVGDSDVKVFSMGRDAAWFKMNAMQHLRSAAKGGFFREERWRDNASKDADLNSLRNTGDFKQFCKENDILLADD